MKTIAQELNVKEFPFEIMDNNGNIIYYEDSSGGWAKTEYNSNGNEIYHENSHGEWMKKGYDSNGNQNYHENSHGVWWKREFDSNGNVIYFEDSNGEITNKRKVELTLDEVAKKFKIDVKNLKIKK